MNLATVTQVLERVSVNPNLSGAISSAEAALSAATPLIENLLESGVVLARVTDHYTPSVKYSGKPVTLYLSHMLIKKSKPVTVEYGVYTGDSGTEEYTALPIDQYSVDYQYGTLSLVSTPASGMRSVRVTYTCGFDDETDEDIPKWLSESAVTAAVYIMHTQVAAHGKQDILDISPEYRRMLYATLQQHLRPRMNCIFAEYTDEAILI